MMRALGQEVRKAWAASGRAPGRGLTCRRRCRTSAGRCSGTTLQRLPSARCTCATPASWRTSPHLMPLPSGAPQPLCHAVPMRTVMPVVGFDVCLEWVMQAHVQNENGRHLLPQQRLGFICARKLACTSRLQCRQRVLSQGGSCKVRQCHLQMNTFWAGCRRARPQRWTRRAACY